MENFELKTKIKTIKRKEKGNIIGIKIRKHIFLIQIQHCQNLKTEKFFLLALGCS